MSFDSFVIERWQRDRDVFVSTAKELGATVNVQNANGDIEKQKEQIEYFINKGVDDNKIHIINMIVDATRFNGVEKDNSVERSIVYCGSGMNTKDGLDDLIKSFKIVADKYKDVKLYIIGEKPDGEILNSPMKLVKDYGINDRVVFTGTKRPEEMPQILVNATLLALARPDNLQAKYGFPTKLGEYLLSSNPVVITSVGNISDFLTDKVDALIVPPNNPEAFAERIAWVLENSAESERIGKNGKVVAMNSFNASIESKKMIDVILNS